jgi:hypothetical protein
MPTAVELKGPFDQALRKYIEANDALVRRLGREGAGPSVWTATQTATLARILDMVENLGDAVAEMAIRVRDD